VRESTDRPAGKKAVRAWLITIELVDREFFLDGELYGVRRDTQISLISSRAWWRADRAIPKLMLHLGTASALRTSAFRRSTMGFGMFAARPCGQEITSKPGETVSSMVGTSGKSGQRVLPVTARARTRPTSRGC